MKYDIEELLKQSFQQEQLPEPALQEKILEQMKKKKKKSYFLSWKIPAIAGVALCSLVLVFVGYFDFQNENGESNVDRMAVATLQPEITEEAEEEEQKAEETKEPVVLVENAVESESSEDGKTEAETTEQVKQDTEAELTEPAVEPEKKQDTEVEPTEPVVKTKETAPSKTAVPKRKEPTKPKVSEKPTQTEEPMILLCSLEDASYAMEWIPLSWEYPVDKPVEESSMVVTGTAVDIRPVSTMVPNSQELETVTIYDPFFQDYREGDMKACVIDSQSRMQEFKQTYQKKTLNGAWKHIVSRLDTYDGAFFEQNALVVVCTLETREFAFTLDSVTAEKNKDGRSVLCFRLFNQEKQPQSTSSAFYMYHRAVIRVPKSLLYAYEAGEIIVNDKKIEVEW